MLSDAVVLHRTSASCPSLMVLSRFWISSCSAAVLNTSPSDEMRSRSWATACLW